MSDVDDLVTWLRAQLDDDEQIAREAAEEGDGQWRLATYQDGTTTAWHGEVEVMTSLDGTDAVHIRNWDPARVLAEVDAKRRILDALLNERHQVVDDCWYTCPAATEAVEGETNCDDDAGTECRCGRDYRADRCARLLALPYADRPGYRDEWKP